MMRPPLSRIRLWFYLALLAAALFLPLSLIAGFALAGLLFGLSFGRIQTSDLNVIGVVLSAANIVVWVLGGVMAVWMIVRSILAFRSVSPKERRSIIISLGVVASVVAFLLQWWLR